jgi:hypothetical protein
MLLAIVGGCRGARRATASVTPAVATAALDSAVRVGARADSIPADSMRSDSLVEAKKAAGADSAVTKDSLARGAAKLAIVPLRGGDGG